MPKFSMGSWAFSFGPYAANPVPLGRVAEHLSKAGYDGIELCGFPPHASPDELPTSASRRDLQARLSGLGLGVSGFAADFTAVNPAAVGNKARYLELFKRTLDVCAGVGSPSIRVDSVAAPVSIPAAEMGEAMERLADCWHCVSSFAEKAGIKVVWEFEPGFAFNNSRQVGELYERVAHPNFYLLFDTAHAHMCGVTLDECAGRIGALHLVDSDNTLYADETSTHCAVGKGIIDFDSMVPKLRAMKLDWWTVDLSFREDSWDLVAPSLACIKKLASGEPVGEPAIAGPLTSAKQSKPPGRPK
ncbi:MAG: sugar phosphate isomerase/epimerase [Acidobacteria bacterium]|nr:sugar phosphate isomerase/epimerase [Acidobacteriota bacterium]